MSEFLCWPSATLASLSLFCPLNAREKWNSWALSAASIYLAPLSYCHSSDFITLKSMFAPLFLFLFVFCFNSVSLISALPVTFLSHFKSMLSHIYRVNLVLVHTVQHSKALSYFRIIYLRYVVVCPRVNWSHLYEEAGDTRLKYLVTESHVSFSLLCNITTTQLKEKG